VSFVKMSFFKGATQPP